MDMLQYVAQTCPDRSKYDLHGHDIDHDMNREYCKINLAQAGSDCDDSFVGCADEYLL